jgi:ribonuclease Z
MLSPMIPKEPPRQPPLGFLYVPPFRVQGSSIAGEHTVVHVPELDLAFDMGTCPRAVLPAQIVALSHGHMDHTAALPYYFSQRHFQGMEPGVVVCHPKLAEPLEAMLKAWVPVEHQRTPHTVSPLAPDEQVPLKGNMVLRAFETNHTVPSLGYCVVELRSKLKDELQGLPQERLVELKQAGEQITQTLEIPLVCYTGDTGWGEHFDRPDVLKSKVLITECTFLDEVDHGRANIGKHLHAEHLVQLLERSEAEAVVLVHLSRRTHMGQARRALERIVPHQHLERVLVLMDNRTNRARYERQTEEAQAAG